MTHFNSYIGDILHAKVEYTDVRVWMHSFCRLEVLESQVSHSAVVTTNV